MVYFTPNWRTVGNCGHCHKALWTGENLCGAPLSTIEVATSAMERYVPSRVFPNSSQTEDLSGANVSARGLFSRAATAFLGSVLYIGLIPNMEGDKVW